MSIFRWQTPAALTVALDTALNGLADSTSDTTGFSALSSEINNEDDRKQFIAFELVLATQGGARALGANVEVYLASAVDATPNYPDTANAAFSPGPLTAFQLDAATTARRLTLVNIPIPPFKFKLYVRNDTGQALAGSGNTLKYRKYNEEVI